MATIRKRGNKFKAQVRTAGFQSVTKSFERLTEAKAWARRRFLNPFLDFRNNRRG